MLEYIKYRLIYLYPFSSWINKYLKFIANNYARRNGLYEETCREIAEYTHESVDMVKQKHKKGTDERDKTAIFENPDSLTEEKTEGFYKSYANYLYELPLWNAERGRPYYLWHVIKPYIMLNSYKSILEYGGGAGDFCIETAKHNFNIDYYDISQILFGFVKWRFMRRNIKADIYNDITEVNKSYDCIVSFDVFEHLIDLPTHIEMISGNIRKGGSLIFSGAFSGGSLHLKANEIYNDFNIMDALLSSHNLKFSNKFSQFYFYKKI